MVSSLALALVRAGSLLVAAYLPEVFVRALTAQVAKMPEAAAPAANQTEFAKRAAERWVAGWAGARHAYWAAGRPEF